MNSALFSLSTSISSATDRQFNVNAVSHRGDSMTIDSCEYHRRKTHVRRPRRRRRRKETEIGTTSDHSLAHSFTRTTTTIIDNNENGYDSITVIWFSFGYRLHVFIDEKWELWGSLDCCIRTQTQTENLSFPIDRRIKASTRETKKRFLAQNTVTSVEQKSIFNQWQGWRATSCSFSW